MKRFIGVALCLLCVSSAWALSEAERAVIWTRCWDAVRYYFPGFDDKQAAAWDEKFDSNLRTLEAAGSDVEFWRTLRMIIATLGDGRTSIQAPSGLPRIYDTVPIRFVLAGDKLLVKQLGKSPEVESSGIRIGDELLSIDRVPAMDHLRRECLPHVAGSTEHGRMAAAAWRILVGPADSMAELVLRRSNGRQISVALKRDSGMNGGYFQELVVLEGVSAKKFPVSVLYLKIAQRWSDYSQQAVLDQLAEDPRIENLILDLRDTREGIVPRRLLEKLALFPLPMGPYREMNWVTNLRPDDPTKLQLTREWRETEPQMIEPALEPFRGKVVVLVSAETAGPAEQFLEPLVFADRVTLIGDTTAGAGGQAFEIEFAGGAKLAVTARQPKWENGLGQGHGFPPKVYSAFSARSLAAGKDDVLQRALDFIREHAN